MKESALLEQETDFDPSGSAGGPATNAEESAASEAGLRTESSQSRSDETDVTALSNGLSTASIDGDSSRTIDGHGDLEHLSIVQKEAYLVETFPTLKPSLVAYILNKCNGHCGKATDELLNHAWFEDGDVTGEEDRVRVKGIDAFYKEGSAPRGRKGKSRKNRKNGSTMSSGRSSGSTSPPEAAFADNDSVWQVASHDVDFIATRTNLRRADIAVAYRDNNASLPATIMALLNADSAAHAKSGNEDAPLIVANAVDFTLDFPGIDNDTALALMRITHPPATNAHELAYALLRKPTRATKEGKLEVIPRYAPLVLSDEESTSSRPIANPPSSPHSATDLHAARAAAFSSASQYHRKGNSSNLMRAAAGYYAQVGRDLSTSLVAATAGEADALVASQSSATQLDLHGVSVKDAERIASREVKKWWGNLGERVVGSGWRVRENVGQGYVIVVGKGTHSAAGRARIGPAVVKLLVGQGWKVEVGSGVLTVTGKARS